MSLEWMYLQQWFQEQGHPLGLVELQQELGYPIDFSDVFTAYCKAWKFN